MYEIETREEKDTTKKLLHFIESKAKYILVG
jgi:hypothetical protein